MQSIELLHNLRGNKVYVLAVQCRHVPALFKCQVNATGHFLQDAAQWVGSVKKGAGGFNGAAISGSSAGSTLANATPSSSTI